jgi:hypothetical protein
VTSENIQNILVISENKNMHLKYVDKKSPVMRPNLQPKIYKSPVVA